MDLDEASLLPRTLLDARELNDLLLLGVFSWLSSDFVVLPLIVSELLLPPLSFPLSLTGASFFKTWLCDGLFLSEEGDWDCELFGRVGEAV